MVWLIVFCLSLMKSVFQKSQRASEKCLYVPVTPVLKVKSWTLHFNLNQIHIQEIAKMVNGCNPWTNHFCPALFSLFFLFVSLFLFPQSVKIIKVQISVWDEHVPGSACPSHANEAELWRVSTTHARPLVCPQDRYSPAFCKCQASFCLAPALWQPRLHNGCHCVRTFLNFVPSSSCCLPCPRFSSRCVSFLPFLSSSAFRSFLRGEVGGGFGGSARMPGDRCPQFSHGSH